MIEKLREAAANADNWLKERGFVCQQRNGQRETLNKNLAEHPRDIKQNEVFIGKLPRNMFEDELLPFLQQAGTIYKMRLMMDFGMTNRGYAFARYTTIQEAKLACQLLDNRKMRPLDPPVGVLPSFDNKRLFFGNLPDLDEAQLHKRLSEKIDNIQSVKLHSKATGNSDKRYAFVEFKTHTDATAARRLLLPGTIKICGRDITVDWAKTESTTNSSQNLDGPPSSRKILNNANNISVNNNNFIMNHHQRPNFNRNNPTPIGSSSSSTHSTLSAGLANCQNRRPTPPSQFKEDWNLHNPSPMLLVNYHQQQYHQRHIPPIGYCSPIKKYIDINNNNIVCGNNENHFKNNILASTQHLNDKNILANNFSSNDINTLSNSNPLGLFKHISDTKLSDPLALNFNKMTDSFNPIVGATTDSVDGNDFVLGHKTREMLEMISTDPIINCNQKLNFVPKQHLCNSQQPQARGFGDSLQIVQKNIDNLIANNNNDMYSCDNVIVIDNIDVNVAPMDKLKDLFELNKRLKISNIYRSGAASLTITYERPEDAELMVETLTYLPTSFIRLSVGQQQLLQARRLVA